MTELLVREYKNEYGLKDRWTYRGNTLIKTEFSYPKEYIISYGTLDGIMLIATVKE